MHTAVVEEGSLNQAKKVLRRDDMCTTNMTEEAPLIRYNKTNNHSHPHALVVIPSSTKGSRDDAARGDRLVELQSSQREMDYRVSRGPPKC